MRKLRFKVQNYQRQHNPMYRDNQLWKKKVLNTEQVSTSTNSGSQTLQEDEEETPIIVPSIMSVLLSILGIVYKVKSRGL